MRTPNRIATKDGYSLSSVVAQYTPAPSGGDGTFPTSTTSNPGGVNGPSGTTGSVVVPVVYFYLVGAPTTWVWTFKKGDVILGISAEKNPVFTFPAAGTYEVVLVSDYGLSTGAIKTHTVVVS